MTPKPADAGRGGWSPPPEEAANPDEEHDHDRDQEVHREEVRPRQGHEGETRPENARD